MALSAYNASVMLSQGASFGQVIAVNGIGIVAGMLGGAGAQAIFGQSAAAALVGGAISGALAAAATDRLYGKTLGYNVFSGAVQGALWGAVGWGAKEYAPVSDASVARTAPEEQGSQSGEAQVQVRVVYRVTAGDSYEQPGPGPLGIPRLRLEPIRIPEPSTTPFEEMLDEWAEWSNEHVFQYVADFINRATYVPPGVSIGVIPFPGVAAEGAATVGEFQLTGTVARESTEVIARGPLAGQLVRPFQSSPLTIQEIMNAEPPIPDPAGVPGAFRWNVPGTFRGTFGTYELVVQMETRLVLHFNFVTP
jgi:hypothetical protein